MQSQGSSFRRESSTTVAADLDSVVTFYRGQFASGEWGEWQENASVARVEKQAAHLEYTGPEGALEVKLESKGARTSIMLITRDAEAAREAGLLPDAGKSRLVVGNLSAKDHAITINGRKYTIKAGAGADDPTKGFNWVVPPGNFTFEVTPSGGRAQSEKVTLGADETWGVLVGPTGEFLSMQLY